MSAEKSRIHVLVRMFGLGDVLMALCAAKAVKASGAEAVWLVTVPGLREVAAACPHVDRVVCSQAELDAVRSAAADAEISVWQLGSPSFGIAAGHQVDAYLQLAGIDATPAQKTLDLDLPPDAAHEAASVIATFPPLPPGARRILLHPAAGDPNRTWPQDRWIGLAAALIAAGHQVVRIGADTPGDARGVQELPVPEIFDAANRLSALATVALMRESELLVSTDSGPVQLAAASEIGIVSLYSVVPGRNRLPYRHGQPMWRARAVEPACRSFPCYHRMHDPAVMAPWAKAMQEGRIDAGRLLSTWCVEDQSYRCMLDEIGVAQVLAACTELLSDRSTVA